jgi:hypothetical protein
MSEGNSHEVGLPSVAGYEDILVVTKTGHDVRT